MNKKVFLILGMVLFVTMFIPFTQVYGSVGEAPQDATLNSIISSANNFFKDSILETDPDNTFIDLSDLFGQITSIIFTIGNLVILCSAAFMGLRYVWSGVQGKSEIKESAMNMSVGVIFFYMAEGLYEFGSTIIKGVIVENVTSFDQVQDNIWSNVVYVVRILALLGFAAVGIKYMMTSANTKADIKKQLLPVIIGLVVIFLMTEVMGTVLGITKEVLNVDNSMVNDIGTPNDDSANATITGTMDRLYATVASVFQVLAVGIVVFTGLRYMFSSADTRADIKGQTIILIAGAVIVFGGIEIIKTVIGIGKDIL